MNAPRFFTSHAGELVRHADCATVRPVFARHFSIIATGAELRATLRAGSHAWPGGYAVAFIMADGGTVCPECVRAELYQCVHSLRHGIADGWRPIALACEAENDSACTCDHCGREVWAGADGAA